MDDLLSQLAAIVPTLSQLGFAVAAWRMASALKTRVDNHEVRIQVVEKLSAVAGVSSNGD